MRKIVAFGAVALLVLSAFGFIVQDAVVGNVPSGSVSDYVSHATISIESDADFAIGANGVVAGDGSAGNPWIIEGWDINGSSGGNCIYIGNTRDHFIIDNCFLHDATYVYDFLSSWNAYGLYLYNVTNGTLRNSVCNYNAYHGASVMYSDYITLHNNTMASNGMGTLYLNQCLHLTLTGNCLIGKCIELMGYPEQYWTTHTIDATNTVNGRPIQYRVGGIEVTIPANAGQIILAGCLSATVENQYFDTPGWGLCAGYCVMGVFRGNSFVRGSEMHAWYGWGNAIYNNTFTAGKLDITASSSNTIRDNVFDGCNDTAILIGGADHNLVRKNTITNTTSISSGWMAAVFVQYSEDTTIDENLIKDNHKGIWLYDSSGVILTKNTLVGDGVTISGNELAEWTSHTIDATNTVNGKPIAYGSNKSSWSVPAGCGQVIVANCSNVDVSDQNVSDADTGIQLFQCTNVSVSSVTACGGYAGLSAISCNRLEIDGGKFDNNNYSGIYVGTSDIVQITDAEASFNEHGLNLERCINVLVSGIAATNNTRSGVIMMADTTPGIHPDNYTVRDCLATGNDNGVDLIMTDNSEMMNNTLIHNNYGIASCDGANNTFSGNTLSENQFGLFLYGESDNNTITDNMFYHNWRAIQLHGVQYGNEVYHNEFIINQMPAVDGGFNSWDDGYPSGGNYWSDYNGTDVMSGINQNLPGSDGLGDDPYWDIWEIPWQYEAFGNITDEYPIMTPSVDLEPPTSNAVSDGAYWRNSPATVKVNCSDEHNTVDEVSLWYSFGPTNGSYSIEVDPPWWEVWSNWTYFGTDDSAPWEWEFDFPSGEGNYQFSTWSVDSEGNNESLTKTHLYMEAGLAYDSTPPIINLTSHLNNSYVTPGDDIQFTAWDDNTYAGITNFTWVMNGGEASDETYSIETVYWSDRHYYINTTATDRAMNVEFRSFEFDVDTQIPTVVSISPPDGAEEVSPDCAIVIEFSEAMNRTSAEESVLSTPDIAFAGASWNAESTVLTLVPAGNLSINMTYQMTVSAGAQDLHGNMLCPRYLWNFTTPLDSDGDGTLDVDDPDDDNDGVPDGDDAFPLDSSESIDTDGDGIGDKADTDDDDDGTSDSEDAFPLDPTEWLDTDSDGTGNNADDDDDGDGVLDVDDFDPLDPDVTEDPDAQNFIGQYWWMFAILVIAIIAGIGAYLIRKKQPRVAQEELPPPPDDGSGEA